VIVAQDDLPIDDVDIDETRNGDWEVDHVVDQSPDNDHDGTDLGTDFGGSFTDGTQGSPSRKDVIEQQDAITGADVVDVHIVLGVARALVNGAFPVESVGAFPDDHEGNVGLQ